MYRIQLKQIVVVLFCIALYTGMQGAKYFLSNRLQELGILISLLLFVGGAFAAAYMVRKKDLKWSWWFLLTICFVVYSVILPGYVFSSQTGYSTLPSIFASREFIGIVIGPALWFLYRSGIDIEQIERAFALTLGSLLISYIFHYFRMDLVATLNSSDHTVAGLVSYDPWRGYRLRPPKTALFLASIITPILIFKEKIRIYRYLWITTLILCLYTWSLFLSRAAMATLLAAVLCYHLFFASKGRLGLLFATLPLIIAGSIYGFTAFLAHLEALGPFDGVRYVSYNIAWDFFLQNPLLGAGQDSNATITFREIHWKYFFPTDIGIVGVMFKYGIVGTFLYLFFTFYILVRVVSTNWLYRKAYGSSNTLLFGLLVLFISFLLNIVLSPELLRITGSSLASIAIALTAIWRHKIISDHLAA